MKRKYYGLLLGCAMVGLAGCSNDPIIDGGEEVNGGGVDESKGYVYFDIDLQLPTAGGGRSTTDNTDPSTPDTGGNGSTPSNGDGTHAADDYEYGHGYENEVRSLLLVIAGNNDDYLISSAVTNMSATSQAGGSGSYEVTASAKFSRADLEGLYADGKYLANNQTVKIYAFCNYTTELSDKINSLSNDAKTGGYAAAGHWLNLVASLTEQVNANPTNTIWAQRAFLMTNAEIKTASLPTTIGGWDAYTSENNPFHLSANNPNSVNNSGAVKVERAAARLDFKDGSVNNADNGGLGNATYAIKGTQTVAEGNNFETDNPTITGTTNKSIALFKVQLTEMSLVNMSNGYHFVRRVSATGNATGWEIGKYEYQTADGGNYVVDTDWEIKQGAGVQQDNIFNHFNFPMFNQSSTFVRDGETIYDYASDGWYTSKITDVLSGTNDTWAQSNNQYHIWRYVTENTIPKNTNGKDDLQKVGQSTGIVFKGELSAGADVNEYYASGNGKVERFVPVAVKEALTSNQTSGKPILYMYGGLLYAGWDGFFAEALADEAGSPNWKGAEAILGNWYLEYTEAQETDGKFDPSKVTSETKFTYSATTPADAEGKKNLKLTVEIYNALTTSSTLEEEDPYKAYQDNKTNIKIDDTLAENTDAFNAAATTNGFTMYAPDATDGKYYCYYFYWNRHNNNGKNSVMGPMEFATVRNNVYKLAVTKIGRIGHPTTPKHDPEPPTPDTPDESDDLYIDVQIQVLPWVVRVNDIEF